MILCNTSAWIEFFRQSDTPVARRLDQAMQEDEVMVGDLILIEVLQGIRLDGQRERIAGIMERFDVRMLCSPTLARDAAENYIRLRKRGLTVRGTIDVVIATWCLQNRVALLHNDRGFVGMQAVLGLECVS